MKLKGYLFGIISAVSYGLIPIFILPIKQMNFPIDTTLFYRFFLSAFMVSIILLVKKESFKINKIEMLILMILGLCYAFSSDFLFWGYDLLSPGIASTILFIYPVIVALIMFFVFKEKINKMTLISLILAFLGVIILSMKNNSFEINFFGLFIVLLSALFYGLYIIIVNKSNLKISGFKLTFYSFVFTSIYYLIKSFIYQETLILPDYNIFFSFILFAFTTTVISSLALVYTIKNIGSTSTSILGALEPVVAVAVSVLLFHELFTINLFSGIVLILVAVIINILANSRNKESF